MCLARVLAPRHAGDALTACRFSLSPFVPPLPDPGRPRDVCGSPIVAPTSRFPKKPSSVILQSAVQADGWRRSSGSVARGSIATSLTLAGGSTAHRQTDLITFPRRVCASCSCTHRRSTPPSANLALASRRTVQPRRFLHQRPDRTTSKTPFRCFANAAQSASPKPRSSARAARRSGRRCRYAHELCSTVEAARRRSRARCAFCRRSFAPEPAVVVCGRCSAPSRLARPGDHLIGRRRGSRAEHLASTTSWEARFDESISCRSAPRCR